MSEKDHVVALLTAPAGFDITVFGTVMVRQLEDGRFAVTELRDGGFERLWESVEMAAADFLGTRVSMRLGKDFEGSARQAKEPSAPAEELELLRELEASLRCKRPNGFRRGLGDDTWMEDVLEKLTAMRAVTPPSTAPAVGGTPAPSSRSKPDEPRCANCGGELYSCDLGIGCRQ